MLTFGRKYVDIGQQHLLQCRHPYHVVYGFAKLLISFAALLVFGAVARTIGGGFAAFQAQLPANYFSLFGNGFWRDIGNGLGIAFGVLTTQVYVQRKSL